MERTELEAAMAALAAQRQLLGDPVVDTSLAALRRQLAETASPDLPHTIMTGERKQVTIMFADISGFTAMSEKLDPEEVRNLINACFDHLGAVINHYEGHIDKFIGDEIMALFGAPMAHENDPERALRAALDMMTALDQFNKLHAHQIPKPLALHFGINTGLVIAGGIGTRDRRDYSVMGDTVNLAARLEDLSETGEILVGEDTYRLTAPMFDFETVPPVNVKGKVRPVQIYRLLRARQIGDQMRGIEGLTSPLVGRQPELTRLNQAVSHLFEGQGSIVTVLGDAGLGKSRLIREVLEADGSDRITWIRGRALSYGQSASYLVARDVFYNLLSLSPETPPTEAAQLLYAEIERLLPQQVAEVYPYLAYLLDLPLDQTALQRVKYLEGEALQRQIHQAARLYLSTRAMAGPLVLTWDDLHWADPSSLSLLKALLPVAETYPLLLILVYRPTRDSRVWAFHQHLIESMPAGHQTVELVPLTLDESRELVGNLIGDNNLQEIQSALVSKADGNPFFIEEVIRSLIETGMLAQAEDNNAWLPTTDIKDIQIPDTLQGVIMARVDQLDPQTKRILQIASVIGRNFAYGVLDQVMNTPRPAG